MNFDNVVYLLPFVFYFIIETWNVGIHNCGHNEETMLITIHVTDILLLFSCISTSLHSYTIHLTSH